MRSALFFIVIALFTSLGYPATIYVPRDHPTIQGAIDAALAGDTIIVSPGTYVENITFPGKAIHLKSESGPVLTAIDGNQVDRVVNFKSGNTSSTVLEGMTITNGRDSAGAGIYCGGSSPMITKCIVRNNTATDEGGGICIRSDSPTVSDCTIVNNLASYEGGGISFHFSTPTITGNTIMGNTATKHGGGISCHDSTSLITNNNIIDNTSFNGGGVYFERRVDSTFEGNVVAFNEATVGSGGGITCGDESNVIAVNNVVTENTAFNGEGGGIICYVGTTLTVSNTILWGNNAATGRELVLRRGATNPSSAALSYSDVFGGLSSCVVDTGCTFSWGPGMIDVDPLFADARNHDFHLTYHSPCRNSGDNAAVTELHDFEGDPRLAEGTVDMGADEFYYHLYSVGDVFPGSPVDLKVVGQPNQTALLALGTGIQDPPKPTPHGDLRLSLPLAKTWQLGPIPSTGILTMSATGPSGWPSGSRHPFQALVGPWGGGATRLTNLHLLTVE